MSLTGIHQARAQQAYQRILETCLAVAADSPHHKYQRIASGWLNDVADDRVPEIRHSFRRAAIRKNVY